MHVSLMPALSASVSVRLSNNLTHITSIISCTMECDVINCDVFRVKGHVTLFLMTSSVVQRVCKCHSCYLYNSGELKKWKEY